MVLREAPDMDLSGIEGIRNKKVLTRKRQGKCSPNYMKQKNNSA